MFWPLMAIILAGTAAIVGGVWIGVHHAFNRCRHDWVVYEKTVLPSACQQMREFKDVKIEEAKAVFYRTKVVLLLRCKTCHQTKVVTEQNP